ncbi:MAG: hypothetical protein EA393_05525 [Bacteroidetes bacterium]|nr:MAG: hypothetical protein EA393_05525 [Bacteroidota bacterium]
MYRIIAINLLMFLFCMKQYILFWLSVPFYRIIQNQKWRKIIAENKETEYLRNVLQRNKPGDLPLSTYEDYHHYISSLTHRSRSVLTHDEILLLEPTSGTTSATKLIPYTKGLQKEFNHAIRVWVAGLYVLKPGLIGTTQYWAISPKSTSHDKTAAVPVGFASDSQYLGGQQGRMMENILSLPPQVQQVSSHASWLWYTCRYLLSDHYLGLISVWHPSFLLLITTFIEENFDGLILSIETGSIPAKVEKQPSLPLKPHAQRAKYLKETKGKIGKIHFPALWPRLQIISCWADNSDDISLKEVKALFPGITIQPKGIIATEGIISFPLGKRSGVAAFMSHHLEFIQIGTEKLKKLHEVETGGIYEPVITTSGGLYRYRMNDQVQITRKLAGILPTMRFLGKRDMVSDIRGEKVSLLQAQEIRSHWQSRGVEPDFFMLSPVEDGKNAFYVCYVYSSKPEKIIDTYRKLTIKAEEILSSNFYYAHARKLGQLKELRIFLLSHDPTREILRIQEKRGTKLGDIKIMELSRHTQWHTHFKGRFL